MASQRILDSRGRRELWRQVVNIPPGGGPTRRDVTVIRRLKPRSLHPDALAAEIRDVAPEGRGEWSREDILRVRDLLLNESSRFSIMRRCGHPRPSRWMDVIQARGPRW